MRYPLPPNFPPNFPPRNSLIATIPAALIPSTAPKSESRPSGTTDSSETRNRRNSVSSRSIMSVLSQGTSSSSKTLSSFSDDDKEAWPQAQKLRKSSLSLMKSSSEITSSSSSPLRKHMSKVSMSSNGSALPSDSRDTITFHPSKGPFTVEKLDKFASATGWLNKYSTPTFGFTAKSWKKRYFILVDTIYFAFKSHDPAAVYFDHFELIPGTIAFVTDDHDPRLYVIKIMRPDGRIWYVQAEDEKYLKIWLTELKRVVARLRDASSFPRQSTESAAFGTTSGTDSTISASLPSTPRRSISSLPSISTAISSDSTSVFTHDGEITPTTPTISPPSSPPPRHASATQYFTSHSFATPPLPKQLLSRADSIGGTLSYGSSPESQYLAHDYVAERLHSKRPLSPTRSPQGTRRRASNYKTLSRILPPQLPPPMAALPAPPSPNFDGDDLPPPARPAPQLPLPPIPGSPTLPSPGGASVSSPASLTPTHSTFPSPRPSLQLDNGVFQSAINAVHDDQTEYSRGEDIRKMALSRIPAGSTEVLRRSSSARLVRSGGNAVDDGHVQVGAVDGEVEQ
ncbi:hypothetical protein BC938DRAFT_481151 [Jimgerdemannia flammicorona]|uniref:PH domain-containing protein n=1 Tax=Jimgerdemannia flammicorona TaxID=994334 RepID=A0A433QGR2_9FUNG|nr:hypothetical protein BC938DRAFT_481151 [Jimgerdemannia flammicorona]